MPGYFLIRKPGGGSYVRGPDFLRAPESITGAGSAGATVDVEGLGDIASMFAVERGRGGYAPSRKLPDRQERQDRRRRRREPQEQPEEPLRLITGSGSAGAAVAAVAGSAMIRYEGRGAIVTAPSLDGIGIVESEDWLIFDDIGLAA